MSRIVKEPEERREELLQIGIKLFIQGGDINVSIQKVVKTANVAIGLFYYYFKTKEEFLEKAHERYLHDYVGDLEKVILDKSITVMDRLSLMMEQFSIRFHEVSKMYQDKPPNNPKHFAVLESLIINKLTESVTIYVKEGCDAGYFHTTQADLTALFIVCGLVGVLQRIHFVGNHQVDDEIQRIVFAALSIAGDNL